MGFNYRKERIKFEKQMEENERKYRDAGMSESQIRAMREYEEEMFWKERVHGIHIVLEESKEYLGLIERAESYDIYFQDMRISLDNILDNIHEELHPETKATYKGGSFRGNQHKEVAEKNSVTTKGFVQDTAEKLGVSPRTVEKQIQTAKNLTPKSKEIIRSSDTDITKTDALKLSRLEPEQQEDAAAQLVSGVIASVDEYKKPYSLGGKRFHSMEESIADLKNPDKDASYTADTLLAGMDGLIDNFHHNFSWYSLPMCTEAYPLINQEQFDYIKKRFAGVTLAIEELLQDIERSLIHEQQQGT